ncbi:MAG: Na+-transporting NADH:ubiquinone oxidoreductase subunit C [Arenicella sp.]
MQRSNGYIIGFSVLLTLVLGGLLTAASLALKDTQKIAIELDTRKQILAAVINTTDVDKKLLSKKYDERIKATVVDYKGEEISGVEAAKVDIRKQYKKSEEERFYPVYKYMDEKNPEKVEAYVIPIYGNGLWDNIWGYLAVNPEYTEIVGVSFDHKGETPGLGARITEKRVQDRYKGKKIVSSSGDIVSVSMVKGEGNLNLTDYQVDGMSGATITGDGVNVMLEKYITCYKNYFDKVKKS